MDSIIDIGVNLPMRFVVGVATYLYHVTVGDEKQKIATEDNAISALEAAIRREFSISADTQLRLQVEDRDFPGEWVNLKPDKLPPTKAKINVIIIGKYVIARMDASIVIRIRT